MLLAQQEKPWPRDPLTHIILGAEPFDFGKGDHAVMFIHGWTSSPRELRFMAERIASQGKRCKGVLLPGHGRTYRAMLNTRFSDYLGHCEEVFGELALAHESVSLVGLSLGGMLALALAARRKVKNLVLFAPFLRPAGSTLGISNQRLAGLAHLWTDEIPKDPLGPINDAEALSQHIAYHAMPAQGLSDIIQAGVETLSLTPRITSPTLIFHSVKDRTSDFSGSLELMRILGSDDKTLIALNKGNHVITLDSERTRLETETLRWMDLRN